jgi:nitrite reductase (NADH) small subunit
MDETWTKVGTRAEIEARKTRRVQVGARWVALHVWNEAVRAIGDECPHRGATLSNGCVKSDGYVECPEHGWEYHLVTGKGREDWEGCVAQYEVSERDGVVYVRAVSSSSAASRA